MSTQNVKDEARRLLDRLPDNLTWDELMHEIIVRQAIEAGLADSKAERTLDVAEIRERFGRRPLRMQLSREEVLKRMKEFSKRKEQFLAAARTGKD